MVGIATVVYESSGQRIDVMTLTTWNDHSLLDLSSVDHYFAQ